MLLRAAYCRDLRKAREEGNTVVGSGQEMSLATTWKHDNRHDQKLVPGARGVGLAGLPAAEAARGVTEPRGRSGARAAHPAAAPAPAPEAPLPDRGEAPHQPLARRRTRSCGRRALK